ncbi:hypothetical protein EDD86DRAFT_250599 [Gorgonomyces haynaldii]|nr:hypothetical protein EDD86DRAFT_250599 [Gorgonomyces haynaldii]
MQFICAKGYTLVLEGDTIVQASQNLLDKRQLIGTDIHEILPQYKDLEMEKALIPEGRASFHQFELQFEIDLIERYYVSAHFESKHLVLEFEEYFDKRGYMEPIESLFPFVDSQTQAFLPSTAEMHPIFIAQYLDAVETKLSEFTSMNDLARYLILAITGFEGSLACQFDRSFNATMLGEDSDGDFNLYRSMSFNARTRARMTPEQIEFLMQGLTGALYSHMIFDRDLPQIPLVPDIPFGPHAIVFKSIQNAMLTRSLIYIKLECFGTLWGSVSLHSNRDAMKLGYTISRSIERLVTSIGAKASRELSIRFLETMDAARIPSRSHSQPGDFMFSFCKQLLPLLNAQGFLLNILQDPQVYVPEGQEDMYLDLIHEFKKHKLYKIRTSIFILEDKVLNLDKRFSQAMPGYLYIPTLVSFDGFAVFLRNRNASGFLDAQEWSQTEVNLAQFASQVFATFLNHRLEQQLSSKLLGRDMRTPLNAVMNFLELSLQEQWPMEIKTNLELAFSASHSLLHTLQDILSVTLLSKKTSLAIKNKRFHLHSVLRSTFAVYAKPTEHVKFHLDMDQRQCDLVLYGDAPKMTQIIVNLLSNAFKYTTHGHVHCKIEVEIKELIGIPQEHIQGVFQEFERIESTHPLRAQKEGLGLGLSIVAELLHVMQGTVTVNSNNYGSTFLITIPFQMLCENISPTNTKEKRSLRLLVAEDNLVNQRVVQKRLQKLGYSVILTADGNQCFELFKEKHHDLDAILMDIMMPVCDGMQATIKIRDFESKSCLQRIPIVAVTANVSPSDIEKYLRCGLDACFGKPIDFDKLDHYLTGTEQIDLRGSLGFV